MQVRRQPHTLDRRARELTRWLHLPANKHRKLFNHFFPHFGSLVGNRRPVVSHAQLADNTDIYEPQVRPGNQARPSSREAQASLLRTVRTRPTSPRTATESQPSITTSQLVTVKQRQPEQQQQQQQQKQQLYTLFINICLLLLLLLYALFRVFY